VKYKDFAPVSAFGHRAYLTSAGLIQ